MKQSTPRFQPFGALDRLQQIEASSLAAPYVSRAAEAAGGTVVSGEVLVILADGRTTAVPASGMASMTPTNNAKI